MDKDYLGDGVYVEHDGYNIILTTERDNGIETIYLEPPVLAALVRYRDRLLAKVAAAQQQDETIH